MSIDEWRSDHAINLFLFFSLGVAFGTRKYEQSSDHLIDNLGMTWKCPQCVLPRADVAYFKSKLLEMNAPSCVLKKFFLQYNLVLM